MKHGDNQKTAKKTKYPTPTWDGCNKIRDYNYCGMVILRIR